MRLLIVTQVVDRTDPVLGFFHAWIEALASRCDEITVICLQKGEYVLPKNVQVLSLGKENGPASSLMYAFRFYKRVWQIRGSYDAVLVHMNPEYVVLAGWLWRLTGKRVVLWYTHKSVDVKLRLAVFFANAIATASPESLRLQTQKKVVLGHGIDLARYTQSHTLIPGFPRLLSVGRISETKNQRRIVEAFKLLRGSMPGATLTIVGAPATKADQAYEASLKTDVAEVGEHITLRGALPPQDMPALYGSHDLLVHASDTGSLDKVVLEALASGMRVVSTSDAFTETDLPVMRAHMDAAALSQAVEKSLLLSWDGSAARMQITKTHDLTVLTQRLMTLLSGEGRMR